MSTTEQDLDSTPGIDAEAFFDGRRVGLGARLKIRDRVLKGVAHFEEAKSLEPVAFLQNSDGMLEICVWQGSALEKLKLQSGDEVMLVEDPEPRISPAATKA